MANEELVNRPLVKAWLWWALVWLTVFPITGTPVSRNGMAPFPCGSSSSWLDCSSGACTT
jgi:hypothetical protein